MELDAVEELRRAGMKGYGFMLIDGVELVDNVPPQLEMEKAFLR